MKALYALALAASFLFTGCVKDRLQPGGAYAPTVVTTSTYTVTNTDGMVVTNSLSVTNATALPDYPFFIVDSTFKVTYTALDAVFTFERENRALLWQLSPSIKHSLDAIRPQANDIVKDFGIARASYKANPTPAGLNTMNTIIAKLKQLQASAAALVPTTINAK